MLRPKGAIAVGHTGHRGWGARPIASGSDLLQGELELFQRVRPVESCDDRA